MPATSPTGPLRGIRVIDIATDRGEYAGRVLADLGADVIKVEPPGGSPSRRIPPFAAGREQDPDGSLYWAAMSLGKRSVVLDIASDAGRDDLRRLAQHADILIESFDPGVMASHGLGYADLRALNPALIYASITPFGQDGPGALTPASEITAQAAGGLISMQGDWDRRPVPVGEPHQAAYHAGAQAAADAIIALNERNRSGLGQHLDTSMQAAVVWTLMNATGFPSCEQRDPPGFGDERGEGPVSLMAAALERIGITDVDCPSLWPCADGYIAAMFTPRETGARSILGFLQWIDEEGGLGDDADLLAVDWENWIMDFVEGKQQVDTWKRALAQIGAFLPSKTKRELMDRGVPRDLFIAGVYDVRDLHEDPHLAERDFWPTIGDRAHPGPFAKLSGTPLGPTADAPALDADRDALTESHAPIAPAPSGGERRPPFDGLKIADFSWIGVGPIVAKAFADHGATVVHVESEARPDGLRKGPPFKNAEEGLDNAQFFANFNSSKLGLALDLTKPEGVEAAHRLVDWADVVVESFTPGTMARFGLDYATLSRTRPDLIMFSTCLRGQTGPEAALAGFGNQGATLSGLHHITGWPDRAPAGPWAAYTDFVTPRFGVAALAAAIWERARTGQGQYVDVSQVECGIRFLEPLMLDYTVNGNVAPAAGDGSPLASPHGTFAVQGIQRYIALSVATPEEWRALRSVAPLDAFDDPALDALTARQAQADAIDAALRPWIAGQEGPTVARVLQQAGVPAYVVNRPSDLYHDPQLMHRGFFVTLNHTNMGPTPYDGFVTRFSDIPSAPRFAAPCLGEHTEQVLREILEMPAEAMQEYAAAGALA